MRDKPDLMKQNNNINKLSLYFYDLNDEFEVYPIKYPNNKSKINLFNKYTEKKGREFTNLIKEKNNNDLLHNYDEYIKIYKNHFN